MSGIQRRERLYGNAVSRKRSRSQTAAPNSTRLTKGSLVADGAAESISDLGQRRSDYALLVLVWDNFYPACTPGFYDGNAGDLDF
jgi:hypothetical protein